MTIAITPTMSVAQQAHRQHKEFLENLAEQARANELVRRPPPDLASVTATHIVKLPSKKRDKLDAIRAGVCSYYEIADHLYLSKLRRADVAFGRHVGIYLAQEMFGFSGSELARMLDHDRTTIEYAIKKIAARVKADLVVAADMRALKEQIKAEL